jgi:hypothetical protein
MTTDDELSDAETEESDDMYEVYQHQIDEMNERLTALENSQIFQITAHGWIYQ